ncbi:hypothetical protein WS74_0850 [Weissella ceti]|uniref:Uncharacterized protein n=1 Tax=Weissella ceti TaxID=759620 RepID=A0A088GLG6_9LACO|nr:hypothetical protein WS74_0850 [Weissella ceti]
MVKKVRIDALKYLGQYDINARFNIKKRRNTGKVHNFYEINGAYATRDRAMAEISEMKMHLISSITLIEII